MFATEEKRGETEAQPYHAVDVPKNDERRDREQRKNQSGANSINRGVKEHRQKHAAIGAIEEPRQHKSGAEERQKKGGNNWPWEFVSNEGKMPKRPDRSENEARDQGRIFCL